MKTKMKQLIALEVNVADLPKRSTRLFMNGKVIRSELYNI